MIATQTSAWTASSPRTPRSGLQVPSLVSVAAVELSAATNPIMYSATTTLTTMLARCGLLCVR
jgi:hypothetical protein